MNTTIENKETSSVNRKFKEACFAACAKLAKQIDEAKNNIFVQFSDTFRANEELLHMLIREADALARQTEYPHLIFPLLATEKIQSVAQVQKDRQFLFQGRPDQSIAA